MSFTRLPHISTKVGVIRLTYPENVATHQNNLLPIITHIGDSTDTPGLTAEGITGRVLLILTEGILLAVAVPSLIITAKIVHYGGKHVPM